MPNCREYYDNALSSVLSTQKRKLVIRILQFLKKNLVLASKYIESQYQAKRKAVIVQKDTSYVLHMQHGVLSDKKNSVKRPLRQHSTNFFTHISEAEERDR